MSPVYPYVTHIGWVLGIKREPGWSRNAEVWHSLLETTSLVAHWAVRPAGPLRWRGLRTVVVIRVWHCRDNVNGRTACVSV